MVVRGLLVFGVVWVWSFCHLHHAHASVKRRSKQVRQLHQALGDKDPFTRWFSAWMLGALGKQAKSAVAALLQAAKDQKGYVRWSAMGASLRLSPERREVLQAARGMLKDKSWQVRIRVAGALCAAKQEQTRAVELLLRELRGDEPFARVKALVVLGQACTLTHRGVVPALLAVLKGDCRRCKPKAAKLLGRLGVRAKDALPRLIALLSSMEAEVRSAAARALVQLGTDRSISLSPLYQAATGQKPYLRGEVLRILGEIGRRRPSVVTTLVKALASKDRQTRWAVLRALERLGPKAIAAAPTLARWHQKAQKDEARVQKKLLAYLRKGMMPPASARGARSSAWLRALTIGLLAIAPTRPRLVSFSKHANHTVRRGFAIHLERSKSAPCEHFAWLSVMAKDKVEEVRGSALRALGRCKAKAARVIVLLQGVYRKARREEKLTVLDVLGKLGARAPAVTTLLLRALKDEKARVWAEAAAVVKKLGLLACFGRSARKDRKRQRASTVCACGVS